MGSAERWLTEPVNASALPEASSTLGEGSPGACHILPTVLQMNGLFSLSSSPAIPAPNLTLIVHPMLLPPEGFTEARILFHWAAGSGQRSDEPTLVSADCEPARALCVQ
jgi:hypothetical protein